MCITLKPADLKRTKLYAGEARRTDGSYVHVLAYQNEASSAGPNAMVLPLPASGALSPDNVVDTSTFKRFLRDIVQATRRLGLIATAGPVAAAKPSMVFDVGSYTVVLADRAAAVASSLDRVPANKRPRLNAAVLGAFDDLYPGWPLALCCWDGTIEPEPLLWWYEPRFPERLFAPALDAHDGGPPDLDANVIADHHVTFGSTIHPTSFSRQLEGFEYDPKRIDPSMERSLRSYVNYTNKIPEHVRDLLPTAATGTLVEGLVPNGDFWCSTKDLAGNALRFAPGRADRAMAVSLTAGW